MKKFKKKSVQQKSVRQKAVLKGLVDLINYSQKLPFKGVQLPLKILFRTFLVLILFSVFNTPLRACDVSPENYEFTMSAIINVNDPGLLARLGEVTSMAVKMNGECRGSVDVEKGEKGEWMFFLTAYSNVSQGEELSIHLNGTLGSIEVEERLPFINNHMLGSIEEPFLLSGEMVILSTKDVDGSPNSFEDVLHISRDMNGQPYLQNLLSGFVYYNIVSISGRRLKSGVLTQEGKSFFPFEESSLFIVHVSYGTSRTSHYSKKIFFNL